MRTDASGEDIWDSMGAALAGPFGRVAAWITVFAASTVLGAIFLVTAESLSYVQLTDPSSWVDCGQEFLWGVGSWLTDIGYVPFAFILLPLACLVSVWGLLYALACALGFFLVIYDRGTLYLLVGQMMVNPVALILLFEPDALWLALGMQALVVGAGGYFLFRRIHWEYTPLEDELDREVEQALLAESGIAAAASLSTAPPTLEETDIYLPAPEAQRKGSLPLPRDEHKEPPS